MTGTRELGGHPAHLSCYSTFTGRQTKAERSTVGKTIKLVSSRVRLQTHRVSSKAQVFSPHTVWPGKGRGWQGNHHQTAPTGFTANCTVYSRQLCFSRYPIKRAQTTVGADASVSEWLPWLCAVTFVGSSISRFRRISFMCYVSFSNVGIWFVEILKNIFIIYHSFVTP